MAVDPKKMMAMNGKQPEPPPEEDMGEADFAEGAPEEGENAEMMAGGDSKYAPIMELLEDAAETIEDALSETDQGQMLGEDPLAEDQALKVAEILGMLNPDLVLGMKQLMMDISMDEAMELGEHLADEGYASDPDLLGGFLFHLKEVLPNIADEEVVSDETAPAEAPPERVSPVANMRR